MGKAFLLKPLVVDQSVFAVSHPFLATMGAGASAAKDKKEAIKEAFKALDKDGDGEMTKDEVKEFLQKEDKETFTDEVCEALYKDANPDGDGHISVKEFTEWLDKQEEEAAKEEEKKEE